MIGPVRLVRGLDATSRSFVLTTAAVLAAVDGFVVTAVRGAVGTTERVQSPGWTWLVQTGGMLPIMLVVLALVVARARRREGGVSTALAVAAATVLLATVVGVGALVLDGLVDHRLQVAEMPSMPQSHDMASTAGPVEHAIAANLDVHARAIGLGALLLLVVHVPVVLWMLALHGGGQRPAATLRGRG